MIKLCSSSVVTVAEDGSTKVFEPEEIQAKLVKSFIAAGMRDTWIAEDIALSVEYSLGELASSKVFTIQEIDSFVVKVLHEVGLPVIADIYSNIESKGLKTIPLSMDRISEVVSRFLGIEGEELFSTSEKVFKASNVLGIKEAFPSLVLELSKYYRHEHFKSVTKHISTHPTNIAEGIWLVTENKILEQLPEKPCRMVADKIISFAGVSKLFPSVRIDINFVNFATKLAITPPVTELALIPFFDQLAEAVEEVITVTENLYNRTIKENNKLPVYLKFTDAILFSTEWLGGKWPEAAEYLEDLVTDLTDIIDRDLTVRNLQL